MSRWLLLLLAGSFFLNGCAAGKVKSGATINGVDVGGLTYEEAVRRVRETLQKERVPLVVHTSSGDFEADLDFSDDVEELVRTARRGNYVATLRREWVRLEEDALAICEKNAKEGVDASFTFSAEGFCYDGGEAGTVCDYEKLVADAAAALRCGEREISLSCRARLPRVTVEDLYAKTRLLSVCSTRYDPANLPRSHNIALAAGRISGTTVAAGETFSFNETVGRRTAENGFEEAAVIADGEFVQGVGGGVCQVSTTLFGAALRAGLKITESRPHSLSVGYVPPSQDAMVSEYSDLKFENPYPFDIFMLASAREGRVEFFVFGTDGGIRYEVESRVLFTLDPPPARIVEGERDRTVRAEKKGLASESWLLAYEGDVLLSRTLIRRDTYSFVQGIEERAPVPLTPSEILEEES